MKGIVFNVFEEFVCENFGEETWEDILDSCTLVTQEPFVAPGGYPDEDLLEIVGKAVATLEIPLPDALRAFGRFLFGHLAAVTPVFVEDVNDAKEFLLSVEDIIHVEVRKLFPGAVTPRFVYGDPAPDRLEIEYRSERGFCHLMEGLIDGVAEWFKVSIEREQTHCKHEGGDRCLFSLTFAEAPAGA